MPATTGASFRPGDAGRRAGHAAAPPSPRAVLVAGLGLLGGLAAAALLTILAVNLVTLTAGASLPEPPLAIAVNWRLVALACAVYAVLTAGLVALAARRAV